MQNKDKSEGNAPLFLLGFLYLCIPKRKRMDSISARRRFSAWLLLLVFVPTMVATSLHIHERQGADESVCVQCAHHVHHGGHLKAFSDHVCDCLLCQFAGQSFVVAAVVAISLPVIVLRAVCAVYGDCLCDGVCGISSTRAPPLF